jgi:hypothetical protein
MIMPGTVGDKWFIGVPEIASVLSSLVYLYIFYCINKESFVTKRNPYIEESKHFHY